MHQRNMKINRRHYIIFYMIFLFCCTSHTFAGPPFITNDPVPEPYKHLDMYLFSFTVQTNTNTTAQVPALELQYGLVPNLEINATFPYEFYLPRTKNTSYASGIGDIQLGIDYRFIQETGNCPQVAFSPGVTIPTGDYNNGLGNGEMTILLPIWLQKSWGKWVVYGGGGYQINNAENSHNSFLGGMVLQQNINEKLSLGGEIFSQTAVSNTVPFTAILNVGGNYNITNTFSVLASIGHSFAGGSNFVTYAGLNWSF